jgi:hypothetical protein
LKVIRLDNSKVDLLVDPMAELAGTMAAHWVGYWAILMEQLLVHLRADL